MLIDWSDGFEAMLHDLDKRVDAGDQSASTTRDLIEAELNYLQRLSSEPDDDAPSLRRVRQSGRHVVWRVSHPYRAGYAVRTIVWFPGDGTVVVALFANNKAQMGDVFYDSVTARADQIIDQWLRERKAGS